MALKSRPTACVVGAGFVGPAHVEALRRNGTEVLALVADGEDEARLRAAEMNIPRWYASLAEALSSSGADVYHLAVPNALHAPYARQVLAAGRSVICEKPLAMTSQESAELVALARQSRQVAAVSYNLRFYPMVREARERVATGGLGRVHAVHGTYLQDWLLYDTDWNWRLDPSRGGVLRAVADIGTHWFDVATHVTGLKVTRVFADFSTVHPVRYRPRSQVLTFSGAEPSTASDRDEVPMKTEDQASILLRFSNGAIGTLLVSQVSAGRKNSLSLEVDGGLGSLAWNSESPNHLWLGHRREPNQVLDKDPALLSPAARVLAGYPGGHQEGYPDTFRQFFASVYGYLARGELDAARDFPTFEDGHREMVTCDALLESARTGRWVDLPG